MKPLTVTLEFIKLIQSGADQEGFKRGFEAGKSAALTDMIRARDGKP